MNIQTLQTWLPIIKDIVTILATAIAALVAIRGYQTWKKQLHWKTQYELAQRLLRATYGVREALSALRRHITAEESAQATAEVHKGKKYSSLLAEVTELGEEGEIDISDDTISRYVVYRKRWQKAQVAFTELENVSLEAEAIWGPLVREIMKPLWECVTKLSEAITRNFYRRATEDARSQDWHILHPPFPFSWLAESSRLPSSSRWLSSLRPAKDDFLNEITSAVQKIENFLKPYLKL